MNMNVTSPAGDNCLLKVFVCLLQKYVIFFTDNVNHVYTLYSLNLKKPDMVLHLRDAAFILFHAWGVCVSISV